MKNKLHKIALALMVSSLAACGGSGGSSSSTISSGNSAPVINTELLNTDRGSAKTIMAFGEEVSRWEVIFDESETSFPDPRVANASVDFFDIDLLFGVSDPDGDTLSIEDLSFVWSGPNCANTIADAKEFPEVCNEFLIAAGVDPESKIPPLPDEFQAIRELQNLPVVDELLYGFELLQTKLRVTPRNFAPILLSEQTAELGISFTITDGVNKVTRQILAIVNGNDQAPVFVRIDRNGKPELDDSGNFIPVEPPTVNLSAKNELAVIDMTEGLFDQDIADIAERQRESGDLDAFFNFNNRTIYRQENLSIQNFNVAITGGVDLPEMFELPGDFAFANRVADPITGILTRSELVLRPNRISNLLVAGQVAEVTVNFNVSDGDNLTNREIVLSIVGADDGNNAPFFFDDVVATTTSTAQRLGVNLAQGAIEHESDPISIIGFTPTGDTQEEFGIFINGANVVIDPYLFTYLRPGETKDFTYSYVLSDGLLESETRNLTLSISGVSANLAGRTALSDPGFESGSLANSAWRFEPGSTSESNLFVTDTESHSGVYSLSSTEDGTFTTLGADGIQQNQIDQRDLVYLNVFAKVSKNPWNIMNILLNKGDTLTRNDPALSIRAPSALGVTNEWVERPFTFRAPEFFNPNANETTSLSFLLNETTQLDDVSLIKVDLSRGVTTLIPNGRFNSASTAGWTITGGASVEATLEADRISDPARLEYGLQIVNNTAETQRLELDPNLFPQGAIKTGMRYIIQFDMRTPSYTDATGAIPIDFGIHEVGGANISRRVDFAVRSPTEWTTYYMHIDTSSDSKYFAGDINTDVAFDWESTTVQPVLFIRAGDELQIDNISMYPVPKF